MLQKFLKYIRYEKNYSSHTVLSYKNDLSHFESYLKAEVGGVDYANVDTDIIRNYVVVLMEQGVSARSVGRKLSALRTLFRFLIKFRDANWRAADGIWRGCRTIVRRRRPA